MSSRKTKFFQGGYYHVYNRGTNGNRIFFSSDNYLFLLKLIKEKALKYNITVLVYCLMPNHYHFLLRQESNYSISDFMFAIFNSYPKAIKEVYGGSGRMFQGPFERIHVNKENYLLHLCRYIHRNPIDGKKPLVKNILDWPFSNYHEWLGLRKGELVNHEFITNAFQDVESYKKFVLEYTPPVKLIREMKPYFFDMF